MKTEFDRIAGYKEEKKELYNICNLIKRRDELKEVGGKLPRGLFLIGPNGVGKTILAKCFIIEAKCESVLINYNDIDDASDFIPYIKSKFAEAASKAPCILFIDELDKLIGNGRHFFIDDNFDKSRIILNEINKYSDVDGLFLLIAANKEYILDYSIVRSGRIDKIIEINLPTETERDEILRYYASGKSLDESVNLKKLSKLLRGFSGADIESLLNNAVIKSFTECRKTVSNDDIMGVYYDKVFNCKEKETVLNEKSQKMVSLHEAGHATVALLVNPSSLNCATILSRSDVRGFVSQVSSEEKMTTFEDEKNQIKIALGGLVAEEIFFGERTTGSSNDIRKIKNIIADLVRKQGMCGLDKTNVSIFAREDFPPDDQCSEYRLRKMEDAEDSVLNELYESVKKMINDHKEMVTFIANELMTKKILNKEDIDKIYSKYLS